MRQALARHIGYDKSAASTLSQGQNDSFANACDVLGAQFRAIGGKMGYQMLRPLPGRLQETSMTWCKTGQLSPFCLTNILIHSFKRAAPFR